jgi:hypothetical protein
MEVTLLPIDAPHFKLRLPGSFFETSGCALRQPASPRLALSVRIQPHSRVPEFFAF